MILAELKAQTRDQHDNLETLVDVMNKMFTRDDYKALLTKFYRFYSVVEPLVFANDLAAYGIDTSQRSKIAKLEADLAALDALEEAKAQPQLTIIPSYDSPAKAFGAMYVMEGATLGGQVITRHLKQHLDLSTESGGSFFNSYGERVGPMWKEFGAAITSFSESNGNDDVIIGSARETFDCFASCFTTSSEVAT